MLMRFNYATFLVLTSIAGIDAFLAPATRPHQFSSELHSSIDDNEGFLNALKGSSGGDDVEKEEEEVSGGSSRFKSLMETAKSGAASGGQAIQNPFLNPTPPPQPTAGINLDNLSVEEQAAMLRQLMAKQEGAAAPPLPAPLKQKRTDKAGKPTGRNRDADQISNAADLYFAQLKRDSSVRTMARIHGEEDVADAVMQDIGIQQLKDLIVENPYLKGQKDAENDALRAIPNEVLSSYFESDEETEEAKTRSGISYKELLKQKRSKKVGASLSVPPVESAPAIAQSKPAPVAQQLAPVASLPVPAPVASEPVVTQTQPETVLAQPLPVAPPPVPEPVAQQAPVEIPAPQQTTATSYPDETRQRLRTSMGMLLKHRGGPGFGRGQLKGPEIDSFENMLQEVTAMLREEGLEAAPQDVLMMTNPQAPVPSSSAVNLSQVDSAIACIQGATTMYKNSPPTLKESILVALRAALVSAVDTCSNAAGIGEAADYGITHPGSASIAQIDGVVACIDGAVAMYRNSPDSVKKDVLVALRAALVSAVSTCNNVIGDAAIPSTAYQAPPATEVARASPTAPAATQSATQSVVGDSLAETPFENPEVVSAPATTEVEEDLTASIGPDANSKVLEGIYNKIRAASGNGSLGLRSDLTSSEGSVLAEEISEVRNILMQELDAGIPNPEQLPEKASALSDDGSSSASKYQQMLAKARAEKEAEAK